MKRRAVGLAAVGLVGLVAGLVCRVVVSESVGDVVLLGTAIAVGESLELKPPHHPAIPLSLAVFVVLARDADALQFAITLVVAELVAAVVRSGSVRTRAWLLVGRLLSGAVAAVVFAVVARNESASAILGGALCSIVAALLVNEGVQRARSPRRVVVIRSSLGARLTQRTADLTIVSSAVLMAASFGGVGGDGNLGLWGVVLFSVPALMAMYSFERLAKTKSAFDQTIDALASVPEIGGWVAPGRSYRVADLVVATGEGLGLGPTEIDRLCSAALLGELGRVCLDDPDTTDAREVLRVSAAVLSASPTMAPVGALLSAGLDPGAATPADRIAAQILAACVALEDVTRGEWSSSPAVAAEGVQAIAPGHDSDVVRALRRGLDRRLPTKHSTTTPAPTTRSPIDSTSSIGSGGTI